MLPDYYDNMEKRQGTFINPVYGLFTIKMTENGDVEPVYFILMKNVNIIPKDALSSDARVLCFDLKGSTAGRWTDGIEPTSLMDLTIKPANTATYKDGDFRIGVKSISLDDEQLTKYYEEIKQDADFFARHNIIDYSLVMFISIIPYRDVMSKSDYQKSMLDGEKMNSVIVYNDIVFKNGKALCILEEDINFLPTVYKLRERTQIDQFHKISDSFITKPMYIGEESKTTYTPNSSLERRSINRKKVYKLVEK